MMVNQLFATAAKRKLHNLYHENKEAVEEQEPFLSLSLMMMSE